MLVDALALFAVLVDKLLLCDDEIESLVAFLVIFQVICCVA